MDPYSFMLDKAVCKKLLATCELGVVTFFVCSSVFYECLCWIYFCVLVSVEVLVFSKSGYIFESDLQDLVPLKQ